jgi:zinc transporter, ZIP family
VPDCSAAASLELSTEAIRIAGPVRAVSSSGAAGMRSARRNYRYILLLWSAVAIGAAVATAVGFLAFGYLGQNSPPHLQAFGAGALLAMTAETMIPEAFHNGPRFSGFLAAVGFCVVLLL